MKLFASLRNESLRAPVARKASPAPRACYDGASSAVRPVPWIAAGIRLPEPLEDLIAELIKRRRSSRSALIREALFMCVYGAYRFEQTWEQRQGFCSRQAIAEFRSTSAAPDLGKSTDDFKVWLPQKLKADLATLAQAGDMTCSNYVQAILILHFMGRQLTLDRVAAPRAASEQSEDG